ncbi:CLD19 protein, partial [Balaeniceps rex]|nr:CLD19 protein [Balaeniceps rex]
SIDLDLFSLFLSYSAHIQACRALMIASILLGFIATVISLLGLKCTNVGLSDEDGKVKFAVTGGFLFILGGNIEAEMRMLSILCIAFAARLSKMNTCSWYELGDALYLGWAGSVLYTLGGILLTCSCKGKKKQDY